MRLFLQLLLLIGIMVIHVLEWPHKIKTSQFYLCFNADKGAVQLIEE